MTCTYICLLHLAHWLLPVAAAAISRDCLLLLLPGHLLAGAVAGAASRSATAPLETLRLAAMAGEGMVTAPGYSCVGDGQLPSQLWLFVLRHVAVWYSQL
jgi:hypothetical protein